MIIITLQCVCVLKKTVDGVCSSKAPICMHKQSPARVVPILCLCLFKTKQCFYAYAYDDDFIYCVFLF